MKPHAHRFARRAGLGAPLLVLGLALAMAGCRSGSPQNTYVVREHVHRVDEVVIDRGLARKLELSETRSERRNGRLDVQTQLVNRSSRELRIEWQVEWYDASGLQVAPPTNWKPERLGGGQVLTIRQTALTEDADTMRLNVRETDAIQ